MMAKVSRQIRMVKVAKEIGLVDKRIFKDSLSNLLLFKTFTKPSSLSTDLLHCEGETLGLGDVEVQPSQHVSNRTVCALETSFESVVGKKRRRHSD